MIIKIILKNNRSKDIKIKKILIALYTKQQQIKYD